MPNTPFNNVISPLLLPINRYFRLSHRVITDTLKVFLIAVVLVTISFLFQGDIGLSRADEGFLWYGTIHAALGEVPIRDFQSYDPGRYYWGAAWFKILGNDGIHSLRISCAIFQALGLTFGLLALRRVTKAWWMLAIEGLVLVLWLYPYHRVFELSISMMAVFGAIKLLEKPSLIRHFVVGVFIGLAACFGRNLGLYTSLSFSLLIVFIWSKFDRNLLIRRILVWICGIIVGYLPLLLMFIFVPGFWGSFLGTLLTGYRLGTTNLTLPIPWPWNAHTTSNLMTRFFFLIFPISSFSAVAHLMLTKRHSLKGKTLLIAASFVGLTFMHYAFSRADLEHLSGAISPLLLGLMSVPSVFQFKCKKMFNISYLSILFAATLLSVGRLNPFFLKETAPELYVKKEIGNNSLWINRNTAELIEALTHINHTIKYKEAILIAPHWTTFYPVLDKKSPLRELYFIFPETELRQREMIVELQHNKVNWAILQDNDDLDGRDDLRFKNTHPILWKYLVDVFEVIEHRGSPYNYYLMRRKFNSTPRDMENLSVIQNNYKFFPYINFYR